MSDLFVERNQFTIGPSSRGATRICEQHQRQQPGDFWFVRQQLMQRPA